jgi:hypothetical protein
VDGSDGVLLRVSGRRWCPIWQLWLLFLRPLEMKSRTYGGLWKGGLILGFSMALYQIAMVTFRTIRHGKPDISG